MPKDGFKTMLVRESTYNMWKKKFEAERERLALKGIGSLSAYITYILEQGNQQILHVDGRFQCILLDKAMIVLRDKDKNEIIEIRVDKKGMFCKTDQKSDCIHVGAAYSIPEDEMKKVTGD